MLKKVLHMLFIASLLVGLAGCSQVSLGGKTVSKQAAQKEVNGITDSAVPDFDEMYNSTVEIEVNFDPNGMYKDFQAIKINDGKMLSDILAMIGKSQVIDDETEINNMSGMAAQDTRVLLKASDER